jgi:UTP--glucose-1-phosphate uridylyltransferase
MSPLPVKKALIPLAGAGHAALSLQTVLGADGRPVTVLVHQINELLAAGVDQIGLIVSASARELTAGVVKPFGDRIVWIAQDEARGFGDALWHARNWVAGEPVVVEVCDHLFLSSSDQSCVAQVVTAWQAGGASVCAIQRIRESEVSRVGVVAGKRLDRSPDTYQLEAFLEKPSLTKAELLPHVAGLGSSEYLCSAGLFVLAPSFFAVLDDVRRRGADQLRWLAPALTELMAHETLYGLEYQGRRINLEEPFGLLRAQVAMGLGSPDRDRVLALLLEESIRTTRDREA